MLPLSRQNGYRRRYAALVPGWQSSGDLFERLVRETISPTSQWLDLGGGRGGLIETLHNQVGSVATLDPDLPSLLEHRAHLVPRICALAEAIPLPANQFDLVTATWLLEHLPDPKSVFQELNRVLKPGGTFIFLTPNARHPLLIANQASRLLPRLQQFFVPRLYDRAEADTFPVRYRANTPSTLQALCKQTGFELTIHLVADPTYTAFNDLLFRASMLVENLIPASFKIHLVGIAVKK